MVTNREIQKSSFNKGRIAGEFRQLPLLCHRLCDLSFKSWCYLGLLLHPWLLLFFMQSHHHQNQTPGVGPTIQWFHWPMSFPGVLICIQLLDISARLFYRYIEVTASTCALPYPHQHPLILFVSVILTTIFSAVKSELVESFQGSSPHLFNMSPHSANLTSSLLNVSSCVSSPQYSVNLRKEKSN